MGGLGSRFARMFVRFCKVNLQTRPVPFQGLRQGHQILIGKHRFLVDLLRLHIAFHYLR